VYRRESPARAIRVHEMGTAKITPRGVSRRARESYVGAVDLGLLIAQVEHGPQMHGPALLVLLAFALIAGVVALTRKAMANKRSQRERISKASLVRHETGSDRESVSERGQEAPTGRRSR
jgi:hypothetical protein